MHALDLIMHLGYLATLVHFVMFPPVMHTVSFPNLGYREIFIMIFSLASLLRPPIALLTTHLLVFLSFVVCLPNSPIPGYASFNFLLLSMISYLLQFHLPTSPSPTFFFFVHQTLPLSLFLWNGFKRAVIPIFAFFLPLFLVASYLLFYCLGDFFFRTLESAPHLTAAPDVTTSAFVWLSLIALAVIPISIIMSISSTSPLSGPESDPWDRFSPSIGMESRRVFTKVVAKYSTPYFFPTPFNLLPLVFVCFPSLLLRLFKKTEWQPTLHRVLQGIWVVFILPLSTVTAGLWVWGYF